MIKQFPEIEEFFKQKSFTNDDLDKFRKLLKINYADKRLNKKAQELFDLKLISLEIKTAESTNHLNQKQIKKKKIEDTDENSKLKRKFRKRKKTLYNLSKEIKIDLKTLIKYSNSHLKFPLNQASKVDEYQEDAIKYFFKNTLPSILARKNKREIILKEKKDKRAKERAISNFEYSVIELHQLFREKNQHYFGNIFEFRFPDLEEFQKVFNVEKATITKARLLVKSYFKSNKKNREETYVLKRKNKSLSILQSNEIPKEFSADVSNQNHKLSTSIEDLRDDEIYGICRGLKDNKARRIASLYFNSKQNDDFDLAKSYAVEALKKYGIKKLKYIISLPPKPIDAFDYIQVFDEMDKKAKHINLPIVRFEGLFEKGQKEEFEISFYSETKCEGENKTRYNNILVLKNRNTKKEILKLTRDGRIFPSGKSNRIHAELEIFLTFCKNSKQMILNYGLETGCCSICGRQLTDSKSIKRGVGPVCFQYI